VKNLIIANWKMNFSFNEVNSFFKKFLPLIKKITKTEIIICPAFPLIPKAFYLTKNSKIKIGAQNLFFEEKGPFTGEVSPLMLKDFCSIVILGHSERRKVFNESNNLINKKIIAALKFNLKPVLCVGETLKERQKKVEKKAVLKQLKECLKGLNKQQAKKILIAYEPVWAIGTGKTALPSDIKEMHSFIFKTLSNFFGIKTAKKIKILYGGSVSSKNIKEIISIQNVNGALVGSASLKPKELAKICLAIEN
jgi:triosephosphate isomerase